MKAREKVLLVDPDPSDRALAALVLGEQLPEVEVVQVEGFLAFAEQLEHGGYAAVVAEQQLAWGDGIRVLEVARRREPGALLFLFARELPAGIATLAIQHRVSAYLGKSSAGFLELPRAVRAAMQQARRQRHAETVARAVEQLSIGVLTLSQDGAVRDASSAAARLLGLASEEDLVGQPLATRVAGLGTLPDWRALLEGERRLVEHVFPAAGAEGGARLRLGVWRARDPVDPGDAFFAVLSRRPVAPA
jgi:PAS domain-containing protein